MFFNDGTVRTGYEATTLPSYSVVSFGNYSFTNTGFRAFVVNDYDLPYDGFSLRSTGATSTADDGFRIVANGLITQLYTSNTTTYLDTSLQNIAQGTALSSFDVSSTNDLSVVVGYGAGFSTMGNMYGSVTGYSVSAIPEPSTYAMLGGIGALGLVAWRRRRAKSLRAAASLGLIAGLLGGCASDNTMSVGPRHAATNPESIEIFFDPPTRHHKVIGHTNTESYWGTQAMYVELQKSAAKIGGNAIICSQVQHVTGTNGQANYKSIQARVIRWE